MSANEVNSLRKSDKLDEALNLSIQIMESDPDNIWNKRAASWVYYEYLKKNVQPDKYDVFIEYLNKLKNLKLPEDEKMVFENSAWQIGSIVFSLQKIEPVDYGKINEIFNIIRNFQFRKPSEEYSFIYKAFHKGYQNWANYLSFADWWNFNNFRKEDYENEEFNKRKIVSIVEQAFIAYSKKLLEGTPIDHYGNQKKIDKEKIKQFIPKLEKLIECKPNYVYPPYYKAKLLMILGEKEDALSSFLSFAKQRKNDFWIWEIFAELFSEDKDIKFACYCKALTLNTPEEYLVKLRQTFAGILIERQMYNESKTEIQLCISERERQGWKINNQLSSWTNQDWYKSANANKNNKSLYESYLNKAEEIIYKEIPEDTIVVEFVNNNKKMLNFIKDKQKHGFFKYSGYLNKPQIGDIIKVRFDGEGQNGFYKILSAENAGLDVSSEAIKDFEGVLNIRLNNTFGFIDDIFVESKFIEENNLTDGQFIRGKAILSFNKKKESWGWKLFTISNLD